MAWGIAAVLLCALWVRSYWWKDSVVRNSPGIGYSGSINSREGRIAFSVGESYVAHPFGNRMRIYVPDLKVNEAIIQLPKPQWTVDSGRYFYFGYSQKTSSHLMVPHGALVLMCSSLAVVPWLRYRFSLRTLLIVTTLVAVVCALFYMMRVVPPQ